MARTAREMYHDLWRGGDRTDETLADRMSALRELVLDMVMEIEALRSYVVPIQKSEYYKDPDSGRLKARKAEVRQGGNLDSYRKSYWDTALLSHDAHGDGNHLLRRFYPDHTDADGRVWREALMQQRLGFTETQIAEFKQKARRYQVLT